VSRPAEQSSHDAVRNRNFVNVAPLQLNQEFLRVHCGIPARRTRSVKRGSLRIGSHTGSSL
jgi:hypothetical protein